MGFLDGFGDGFTNVMTLGQCDGGGCGGSHKATWGPVALLNGSVNTIGNGGNGGDDSTSTAEIKQIVTYAVLGLAGFLGLDLVLTLVLDMI